MFLLVKIFLKIFYTLNEESNAEEILANSGKFAKF